MSAIDTVDDSRQRHRDGSKWDWYCGVVWVRLCAGFSDAGHDTGGWARGCRRPRSAKARNRGGLSRSMGIWPGRRWWRRSR